MAGRIKITGDGTVKGTFITMDGEPVKGVQSIRIEAGVHQKPTVALVLKGVELDVEVTAEMGCLDHQPRQHRDGRTPWCDNCHQE